MTPALHQKIASLVPGRADCKGGRDCKECAHSGSIAPLGLADVLQAMQKSGDGALYGVRLSSIDNGSAMFMYFDKQAVQCETLNAEWNLAENLDGQSEPLKAFLRTVLGVTE